MAIDRMADEFQDVECERALLAALSRGEPDLYWQIVDLLPDGAFAAEAATWRALSDARQGEAAAPEVPADWMAAPDPEAAAKRLADLHQRRLLADLAQQVGAAIIDPARAAPDVARLLQEGAARVEAAVAETRAGVLATAADLAAGVIADAEARRAERKATGTVAVGVQTGLPLLDRITSGWRPETLTLLAGGPGVGKTTLALQVAWAAAQAGVPVLDLTAENSPVNLAAKLLCTLAGVQHRDVESGFTDPAALRRAAETHVEALGRIALVEAAPGKTTIPVIRGRARQLMARCRAKQCLIIVDYLQLLARGRDYRNSEHRHNVTAFASDLRTLAATLNTPVLALSSQSREGGQYGNGGGSANLASLKESGELEYHADVVMVLVPSAKRQCTPPARAVDLHVVKNRYGDMGVVPLVFRPDTGAMREETKV